MKYNVVLIEDSPTQAKHIAAYMSEHDVNVMVAENGRQGLRLIDLYRPDAVVMDLYMPALDGFQISRRLKRDEATKDIPIIMVTSSERQQDFIESVTIGVKKFLRKDRNLAENLRLALNDLGILT